MYLLSLYSRYIYIYTIIILYNLIIISVQIEYKRWIGISVDVVEVSRLILLSYITANIYFWQFLLKTFFILFMRIASKHNIDNKNSSS